MIAARYGQLPEFFCPNGDKAARLGVPEVKVAKSEYGTKRRMGADAPIE